MEKQPAIELKNITKKFGKVVANKDVNLTAYRGEILSILGENDKMVYDAMESGKMMTEDNLLSLGLSVGDISTAFLNLEIYGFIEAKPGGFYVKK